MCICNVTDSIDSLEMFELLCIQNSHIACL
ncbi:hypothetical protein ADUPG1_014855, partial [Aduncisulcus paluster]